MLLLKSNISVFLTICPRSSSDSLSRLRSCKMRHQNCGWNCMKCRPQSENRTIDSFHLNTGATKLSWCWKRRSSKSIRTKWLKKSVSWKVWYASSRNFVNRSIWVTSSTRNWLISWKTRLVRSMLARKILFSKMHSRIVSILRCSNR